MCECDALPNKLAALSSAYKGCASLPRPTTLLPRSDRASASPGMVSLSNHYQPDPPHRR